MPIKPAVQLNLTKEQYETLVELCCLGQWMANSIRSEPIEKYDEMQQLVFSFAKQGGLGDRVEHDPKLKAHFPTVEFEDSLLPLKDDYDDYTFWEELIQRLSWRDTERKLGGRIAEGGATEEQRAVHEAFVREYEDEFNRRGLDNVQVPRPQQ